MEMARNVIRSRIQGMSDSEYASYIRDMMRTADNDVEAGKIKTMYDKMRAAESILNRVGIAKQETMNHNVQAIHGVVLLPPKKETIIDAEWPWNPQDCNGQRK